MGSNDKRPQVDILVIDDESKMLGLVKALLERLGYRVHIASSPNEAMKLYEEQWRDISVILLDYMLPGTSGEQVFENLQRLNPDVRVVLLTGCDDSVADKLFEKGLRGYLQKPFSLPDLAQRVGDALDAPAVPSPASQSPA